MKSEFLSLQFHLAKIIVDDVALCSIVLQKKHFPSLLHSYYWVKNVASESQSVGKSIRKIKIELENEWRGWKKEKCLNFLAKIVPSLFTFTFNVIHRR
jgi:hypothetical protein